MKRVVFLDFDGVINRKLWEKVDGEWVRRFGYPEDGRVNDGQAVQWVSEFCEKYGYEIVVTSTWRKYCDCEEILRASGLREGIEILGATSLPLRERAEEISEYLAEHPEIGSYLVFDDKSELMHSDCVHASHLVHCNTAEGFGEKEFLGAVATHMSLTCAKEEKALNVIAGIPEKIPTSAGTLAAAIEMLYETGYITTSLLQRHLRIGYSKAAKMIDALQEQGIVLLRRADGGVRYLPLVEYEEALRLLDTEK